MNDFVAATLSSGPAQSGTTSSARPASGERSSLTRASTCAPARRAASTEASRSGLLPDCEIARHSAPSARGWAA